MRKLACSLLEHRTAASEGGRPVKIFRNWGVHNIVAHPLMQVLIYLRMTALARTIHDATLPSAKESGNEQ